MEKQKVFIPVEDIFHEYDGTYLPKSGKPLNVKEQEVYFLTPEELEEFKKEYTRDTVREIANDFINLFKK